MVHCHYNELHSALGFKGLIKHRDNIISSTFYHITTNEASRLIVCMRSKLLLLPQVILNLKQKGTLNLRMVQVIRHFLENRKKGHKKVTTFLYT
jgi:hypothetical protein